MNTLNIKKTFNSKIRTVLLDNNCVGGEDGLPFMQSEISSGAKPLLAIEILINIPENYPDSLKNIWGSSIYNPVEWAKQAEKHNADILAIRFNINDSQDIDKEIARSKELLENIQNKIKIPLLILGTDKRDLDIKLLTELSNVASKQCTIGMLLEENYKDILPTILKSEQNIIARTPIDINLAKQLNILITEMGFSADKILIDPNIGGLGYGLDYAYSIIERIKLAGLNGDNMLNMPIIAFAGEEAWKSKEAKAIDAPNTWGNQETRGIAWETLTTSSLISAGANIVVMYHPTAVLNIKTFINQL